MKRITKKQKKDFLKEAYALLDDIGAKEQHEFLLYNRSVDTNIGKLWILVDEDIQHVYTIFTKFEDSKRGCEFLDSTNSKMNFHSYNKNACLHDFKINVLPILK